MDVKSFLTELLSALSKFVTETIAFALIKDHQRIWGIDRDNIRDWHIHPLDDPTNHISTEPLSVSNIVETLARIWEEIRK